MLEKLNDLVGKEFNYKGVNILVKKVKIVNGTFVVMTDKRTYNFLRDEVEMFINELKEKKMEVVKQKTEPVESNLNIRNVLFETLEKVRVDKDYIPQANAICNVVSQMINVQKIEMQLKKR